MRTRLILFLFLISFIGYAQKKGTTAPVKKPLTHDVYDSWKEITYSTLTRDGNFAVFTVNPQDGDGKIVLHDIKKNSQDSVHRASNIKLSYDSKFVFFKIDPKKDTVKALRRQKKKKEELPKDSLGIYTLTGKSVEKIPNVKSYAIPEKAAGWLAYQLEDVKAKPDTTKKSKPKKIKKNSSDNGYTLMLRNLSSKQETRFGYVTDYTFAKFGQGLLFTSTGNDSTLSPGVYWYDVSNQSLTTLLEGKKKQKFTGLATSEDGTQVSFVADLDTTKALVRYPKLFLWKKGEASASLIADEKNSSVPKDYAVSADYTPTFSKDGSKLFFGTAPVPMVQDTTLLSEEIVKVEVWNGNDPLIYPMQNVRLKQELKRSYLAAYQIGNRKITQLANLETPKIELGDEGNANIALADTNVPYLKSITWEGGTNSDVYLVDINSGSSAKKLIATSIKGDASLSPKANYAFWYDQLDTAWHAYSIKNEAIAKLTKTLKVSFADEQDDHPDYPSPYGMAGWTEDDKLLIAYDRYDLWAFDPEGKANPVNLTKIGRDQKIVFRYQKLDREERFIKADREIILTAFDETTKASGFYSLSLKNGKLTKLLMTDHAYGGLQKAELADQVLYTRESFREFSDLWTANTSFSSPKKISDANPQMKNYLWGNIELVSWTSLDNIPLKGLLIKPENFDPKKKYPMMVYFYERMSDGLHRHQEPAPIRSSINFSMFASNGYLVFIPDVIYKIGYPGESALNCILPGITSLMTKGFVDEKNIGVQGHSWGGYQIAYLVTRTNIFKAAEAGAPVSNMTSAYGGIRWGTGMSRMFQYERTQTRLGGTLWETPLRFIENSPLFFADKIETPLLMMHNDADGSVPWYQGIEFYMALRRLNKPVWMLNYNGEDHGLQLRQNRTDFAIRMMQYFDYYLKGAPMPEWMESLPATEKGINTGYTLLPQK
jgi:dipeptidyl aminopeptidase/acylaminoacyl peptidase